MTDKSKTLVDFVCAARSRNRVPAGDPNGKRGCIMITRDGTMFEVRKHSKLAPQVGDVLSVEKRKNEYCWWLLGFEEGCFNRCPVEPDIDTVKIAWELADKRKAAENSLVGPNRILRPVYNQPGTVIGG